MADQNTIARQSRSSSSSEETARQGPPILSSIVSFDRRWIVGITLGDRERVEECLKEGADVNKDVGFGVGTALHLACRYAHVEIVQLFLYGGARVKARNGKGQTPLMAACATKETSTRDIVKLLLEWEEDSGINSADDHQSTALTFACQHSSADVVAMLLEHDAEIDVADDDGDTPLILAARYGNEIMVGHILSHHHEKHPGNHPNIDQANQDGEDPLESAILNSNAEAGVGVFERLSQETKSKVDGLRVDWQQKLLFIASEAGNEAIVNLLLDGNRVDVNAQDSRGRTALHLACSKGHMRIAETLLQRQEGSEVAKDLPDRSPWSEFVQFCVKRWESPNQQAPLQAFTDGASRILKYVSLDEKIFAMVLVNTVEDLQKLVRLMSEDPLVCQLYELIGLAARFPDERVRRETFQKELVLEHLAGFPEHLHPTTPLQWCTFHGKRSLVWAMLRNPLSSKELDTDDRPKSIKIVDHFLKGFMEFEEWLIRFVSLDGSEINRTSEHERIKELLENPPVIVGVPNATYRVPSLEGAEHSTRKEEAKRQNATILDFYYWGDRLELLRRSRSVYDVIYATSDVTTGGPEAIMKKARSATGELKWRPEDLGLRWIHLPTNNVR